MGDSEGGSEFGAIEVVITGRSVIKFEKSTELRPTLLDSSSSAVNHFSDIGQLSHPSECGR